MASGASENRVCEETAIQRVNQMQRRSAEEVFQVYSCRACISGRICEDYEPSCKDTDGEREREEEPWNLGAGVSEAQVQASLMTLS